MTVIVSSGGKKVAEFTDSLKLIFSLDTDFTILWNKVISKGVPTIGPPLNYDLDLEKGVLSDVVIAVKPSAGTIRVMEDYLNAQGYELERK